MKMEEALRRILKWHRQKNEIFAFDDVKVPPETLKMLWRRGFLELHTASRRRNYYKANVKKILDFFTREEEEVDIQKIFEGIIGLETHKKIILKALTKGERIHILLVGPPESAKTLILSRIEKLPKTFYVLGATLSDAGLIEQLATRKPKYLLIDEIDKIKKTEIGALLELMETGRLLKTKKNIHIDEMLNSTVIATANRIDKLPHELVSRFLVIKFKPYTRDEFFNICKSLIDSDFSDKIIQAVWEKSKSIRDVIKLSKLIEKEEEIEEFMKVIGEKYG